MLLIRVQVWIDTCCINKSSGAELSESINSMYLWYKRASICYAYLSDVSLQPRDYLGSFRQSKWFTRGWTLQEIIAPCSVEFYSKDWIAFGTRLSLQKHISEVTGIDVAILRGESYARYSVAQKMSWAAKRKTTKPEDIAYCLMGIFSVSMPLLYGEGESEAFYCLQREIMNRTEDHTLFTWQQSGKVRADQGLLSNSPSAFASSALYEPSQLVPTHHARMNAKSEPPALTGRGLRIQLGFLESSAAVALLDVEHAFTKQRACIYLQPESGEPFRRRVNEDFGFLTVEGWDKASTSKVYVHQIHPGLQDLELPAPMSSYVIISAESDCVEPRSCLVYTSAQSNGPTRLWKEWYRPIYARSGASIPFYFDPARTHYQDTGCFCVNFGTNQSLIPWCEVRTDLGNEGQHPQNDVWQMVDVSTKTFLKPGIQIDQITKRLTNNCELSVVVRRRAHVLGEPPPPQTESAKDIHHRWYI
jgi:hypothetical protein